MTTSDKKPMLSAEVMEATERLFAPVEPQRRWLIAFLSAAFSLPWHYIFWYGVYSMLRDRDLPSDGNMYVFVAVGCVAYLLTRWAYLLARGPSNARPLLNDAFLWCLSLVMVGLAFVSLTVTPTNVFAVAVFTLLAAGLGLLVIVRRRRNISVSRSA